MEPVPRTRTAARTCLLIGSGAALLVGMFVALTASICLVLALALGAIAPLLGAAFMETYAGWNLFPVLTKLALAGAALAGAASLPLIALGVPIRRAHRVRGLVRGQADADPRDEK